MIVTLGLVATLCGILIVSAYQGTLEAVAANKRIVLERAVFRVIPGATSMKSFHASSAGIVPASGYQPEGGIAFHAAYDQAGQLKGIAAEGAAMGYADMVRVLYAYDPQRQVIVGFGVVSHRETPGIGDKIITDAAFLKNFQALDVRLAADMKALANAVRTVKHGAKNQPWQIDAITGATVTSKAVGKGINDSAQRLLPLLVPNMEAVKGEGGREKGKNGSAAWVSPFTLYPSPFTAEGIPT
ncbi:MAG: FMN-binding protein [Thiobacillus sp.]|nr:FMN-binding protein [Thiobacillus sp.]